MRRFLAGLVVGVSLTGCSLADFAGAPPAFYELSAPADMVVNAPPSAYQVLISLPSASAGIDTTRVAVVSKEGVLGYFKGISWADRAPMMYQSAILEAFDLSRLLPSVARDNTGLRADFMLASELRDLQVDLASSPPVVRVALQAKLVQMPRRNIVANRAFAADVVAEDLTPKAIMQAFHAASDKVLVELVPWVLGEMADSGKKVSKH